MIKKQTVVKLVENRGNYAPDCLKVLGSLENLYVAADFAGNYPQILELITANGLIEYLKTQSFSKEQADAFRQGLEVFPLFLLACSKEKATIENQKIKSV